MLALLEPAFDDVRVARAYVELPDGWGPQRMVIVACERAGYRVEVHRRFGNSPDRLLLFPTVIEPGS